MAAHRIFPVFILAAILSAQQPAGHGDDKRGYNDTPQIPNQKWKVHDMERPRPRKVAPGLPVASLAPPADAIVLFDGKDLSKWEAQARGGGVEAPRWKVENGYFEIVPRTARLRTKEKFGDCQLHVEWMIPKGQEGAGQGRGNSGVELMSRYEIQVLESSENVTYADGQAASIYGQWPPLVNASRAEGEWNIYDIVFEAPRFEGDKLVKPAYITAIHNGVLVHHRKEILGTAIHRRVATYRPHAAEEPLSLQDHGRPLRYRNIWIRRLRPYDEP
ncbi:MAG: 3-keto-disaccharide hydrolase [Bryobacteraceae bacterium]